MNLKELSEKLGLSQTTVSRALNGYPEVSEATRQRVNQAAKRHNYQPSQRARGLATGRAFAIGHVITSTGKYEMLNPVFGDFIAGAGEAYAARGYQMTLSVVPEDGDELDVYRNLAERASVDGVVVQSPGPQDPRISLLSELGIPFVVHGRASGVDTPYSWVDVNNRAAFEQATRGLIGLGHRRIALINGDESMDFAQRRRAGYMNAHQEAGLTPDPALMTSAEMTETNGHFFAGQMLDSAQPPTAMITSSMISAFGARRAIEERGLAMGRDVSLMTHDDVLSYLPNGDAQPIFSATRSSVRKAGQIVGRLIIDQIESPDQPPVTQLLEAELVLGQSTGPLPAS